MSFLEGMKARGRMGRLKTGLKYTRRSFGFQLRHPIVVALGLLQLVVVWGALFGIGSYALSGDFGEIHPTAIASIVAGYLVVSVLTTLTNAVITSYVFAAEMGVTHPLTHALSHVRRRLSAVLGYAVLAATVLSVLRFGTELLRGRAIVGELAAWVLEATVLAAWYAATIYAVPVLLFEEDTSLRGMISRSASLLGESKWTYATAVSAWPIILAFIVIGIGLLVFVDGAMGLIGLLVAVVTGLVVHRIFNSIFKAYLYGEVAGPFSMSNA